VTREVAGPLTGSEADAVLNPRIPTIDADAASAPRSSAWASSSSSSSWRGEPNCLASRCSRCWST